MAIQPKLDEYPPAPVKMGYSFFKKLRDRVETIAPIPSTESGGPPEDGVQELIKVEYVNNEGCRISFRGKIETLNVCSNGMPTELKVIVPE